MKPNPGGTLDPKDIIGRDEIVKNMYKTLEDRSIMLVSERRVGKTCVLRKLKTYSGKLGVPCFFMEISGLGSPIEFVEKIHGELERSDLLPKSRKTWGFLKKQYKKISGQKIGNWHLPEIKENWKEMLLAIMEDIKKNVESRLILMFDEFPIMLDKIVEKEGFESGINLLDTLRDIRQEDETGKIRMIFCGSIGLHIVLSKLKTKGYKNDPFNDVKTLVLEPLEEKYAVELVQKLSEGCGLNLDNDTDTAKYISHSVDNFPFYIHHIMAELDENRPLLISKNDVDIIIEDIILDPHDKVAFEHYVGRIETHYPEKFKESARFLLGFLSKTDTKKSFDDLWNEVKTNYATTDEELIRRTVELLVKDHYLNQSFESGKMVYEFKYSIIKKWWRMRRG